MPVGFRLRLRHAAWYAYPMKTSVWLPDDIAEQWKASGVSLAELVRRGLHAGEPEPIDDKLRRIIREELERAVGQAHA